MSTAAELAPQARAAVRHGETGLDGLSAGGQTVGISVIVLTYRRVGALLAVLRALAPQCDADTEVLIADDGSPADEVQRMHEGLPAFACPVRHVWHPDVGFTAARARNLAAAVARGRRLLFLDGDCVPHAGFVAMHRRLARPGEFVNGARILLDAALSQKVEGGVVDLTAAGRWQWWRWRLAGQANKLLPPWWPERPGRVERQFRWRGIRSCNFAVWAADFQAVNGFDESFSGWGHEDADLVLRLHHLGVARCNGQWATEVFHLWHRENDRAQEGPNRQRVLDRMGQGLVRAEQGLDGALRRGDMRVNVW